MLLRRYHKKVEPKEEVEEAKKDLSDLKVDELKELASASSIEGYSTMKKDELIQAILEL